MLRYYKVFKEAAEENPWSPSPYRMGMFLVGYNSVDSYLDNPTDEEYETITGGCFNAYMDADDIHMSFAFYTDIVSLAYANKEISLEEIKNWAPRELDNFILDRAC